MIARLALDTNRYTDLARGNAAIVQLVAAADTVFVPIHVLAELRAGFAVGTRGRQNEAVLVRFLGKPGVEVLYPDDGTTHSYAALYRQLRAQGTPIPTNDLWIASLVVQHQLVLCTRDRHFDQLPQLETVG